MKTKDKNPLKDDSVPDRHLDKIEEMWDRSLAKGDDEFYEATRGNEVKTINDNGVSNSSQQQLHSKRKRIKR